MRFDLRELKWLLVLDMAGSEANPATRRGHHRIGLLGDSQYTAVANLGYKFWGKD